MTSIFDGSEMAQQLPQELPQDFARFMQCVHSARKRATKKGETHELSIEQARALWARSGGACEMTKIRFDFTAMPGKRRPFAPSIDRIDSDRGYSIDNLRVVCVAVNLAMNQWGEDVLVRVAVGMLNHIPQAARRPRLRPDSPNKGLELRPSGHWRAHHTIGGEKIHIGTFASVEEARAARRAADGSRVSGSEQ